nr:MAG TPA_asm: hypothetical protein [Caudoviricetes sp.]
MTSRPATINRYPSGLTGRRLLNNPCYFNAYNLCGIRYKKSIGQWVSVLLDSDLGQEEYAKAEFLLCVMMILIRLLCVFKIIKSRVIGAF